MGAIEQGAADGVRDLVAGAIDDNCPESPTRTRQLRLCVIQELAWQTSVCELPTCIERNLLGTGRGSDSEPEPTWLSLGRLAQTSPEGQHGEVSIFGSAELGAPLSELVGRSGRRWLRLWSCRRSCDRPRGRARTCRWRRRNVCCHLHALAADGTHQLTQHPPRPTVEVELPPIAGWVLTGDNKGLSRSKLADLCIVGAWATAHVDSRGGGQPGHFRRGGHDRGRRLWRGCWRLWRGYWRLGCGCRWRLGRC